MSEPNVIEQLQADHRRIEVLLGELDKMQDVELPGLFHALREELIRHEVAEELIVYPVFRRHVEGGEEIVDSRTTEQVATETALFELEQQDPSRPEFRSGLEELRASIREHMREEEVSVIPLLASHASADALSKLGGRYAKAMRATPTHLDQGVPGRRSAHAILGTITAIVDRVRDAMRAA